MRFYYPCKKRALWYKIIGGILMSIYYLKDGRKIFIDEVSESDSDELVDFWNRLGGETDNLTFGFNDFYFNYEQEKTFIDSLKYRDNCLYAAAYINDKIIGSLSFLSSSRKRVMHRGEMGIGILRDYWGCGIGSCLMDYFNRWVNSRGVIKKIDLEVREDNIRAINLYLKYGFEIEGKISRGIFIDNKYYDLYHMGKTIG
jgi:RimJ/RimL family protein N-acetyltransferase